MATSFGTTAKGVVTLRVYRAGAHVRVRVWIGQEGSAGLTGELTMTPADWRQFRALLPAHAPDRLEIRYADNVFEWINRGGEG